MSRPRSPGQDSAGSPYKTQRWRKLRAFALRRANWRCQWCGADIRARHAGRVDHIQTARKRPDLFFEASNVRALCTSCDAKRHREKGGAGTTKERPAIGLDGFPIDDADNWRE